MKEGNEPIPALGKYLTAAHPAAGVKTLGAGAVCVCAEATVYILKSYLHTLFVNVISRPQLP